MARPRKGEEGRFAPLCVRVSTSAADYLHRRSLKTGESVYALGGRIIERVISHYISQIASTTCYGQPESTLSAVLSASAASRPSSDRGSVVPR